MEQRQEEETRNEQPSSPSQRYDLSNKLPLKQRIYLVTDTDKATKTKEQYLRNFNHFLDFINIHDLQVLLDFSPKVIKQMIIDYILFLRDEKPGKKLGKRSIKSHVSAILYFFQINNDDFNLTLRNFKIHLPSDDTEILNEDRPYTRKEIEQVIQNGCNSDLRGKVVILLLCNSGLRMGAISQMRICDLTPMTYKGLNIYKVLVYARTRDKYYTFTTVESTKAIRDYLDYRERCKEQLTDKSPLIREQFNKDNHLLINAPRFVTDKAIEYLIDQAVTRSGIRKPGVVHLSHGFRKYFISQCESSPMKSLHVSMLSGHNTGIKKYYHKPNDSILLEDFMTHAADALTINSKQRLEQENQELRKNQKDYLAELGELKEDFNEMKQLLVHLSKDSQKQLVNEFHQKVGDTADIEWSCD